MKTDQDWYDFGELYFSKKIFLTQDSTLYNAFTSYNVFTICILYAGEQAKNIFYQKIED